MSIILKEIITVVIAWQAELEKQQYRKVLTKKTH
jgi:hypothetical protein